jgi:hypothetical protein
MVKDFVSVRVLVERLILLKPRLVFETTSLLTATSPTLTCAWRLAANDIVAAIRNDAIAAPRAK